MRSLIERGFSLKSYHTWLHSCFPQYRSVVLSPLQKETQAQTIFSPPSCLTVGFVFLGCSSAFFSLQTLQVVFIPKSSVLVSSDLSILPNPLLDYSDGLWTCAGWVTFARFESMAKWCVTKVTFVVPALLGHRTVPCVVL